MNKNRPLKKGGKRAAQKRSKGFKLSAGQKRRQEEALASLNAVMVDSDDNDDNDQDLLSRTLLDKEFDSNLPEGTYFTPRDDQLRQTDIPESLQVCILFPFLSPSLCLRSLYASTIYFVRRKIERDESGHKHSPIILVLPSLGILNS